MAIECALKTVVVMRECLPRFLFGCVVHALNVLLWAATLVAATTEKPIAYWQFDESSGSFAIDSAGNGHTGTIVGTVRSPGKMGGALSFNGVSDYVFASDAEAGGTTGVGLDMGTRDWTIAAWVQTTNSGMVLTKMGFVGGPNPDGWGMSVAGSGTLGGVLSKSSVATVNIFSGDGATVNDGQWHHIAVTG